MLIHTSQRTVHHDRLGKAIINWLKTTDQSSVMNRCKVLWEQETSRLSLARFWEQYPDYGESEEDNSIVVDDYPAYELIEENIRFLLREPPMPIMLGDDGERSYHKGIHICIDNCNNSGFNEEGMHLRLAYPDTANMPDEAPAFIVIGGATLARGLTIEGLISTYFLRSVGQADTLMQMGRWFGYRRGYELIPRIWVTDKTNNQFRFLSALDQELRDEIFDMDARNVSPDDYGPKVKNTPNYRFIRITAKNKMQSAQSADMDYTGSFNQTYLFDTDEDILAKNYSTVISFIESLGTPDLSNGLNKYAETAAVWKGIKFERIKQLIDSYHFQKNLHFGQNLEPYMEWITKVSDEGKLNDWNVIVSGGGKNTDNACKLENCTIAKVSRTRKKLKGQDIPDYSLYDIGVLSDPRDFLADILVTPEMAKDDSELMTVFDNFTSKASKTIRNCRMESTPQLIIYIVDKNSKSHSESRVDLDSKVDLAGLCFNIPGGKRGEHYAATVSVKLAGHEELIDDGDIGDDGN